MDWIGIACLALAAIALAANQALKDAPVLTASMQWLRPKGWWNYLPLAFLILAGLAYGASWLGKQSAVLPSNEPAKLAASPKRGAPDPNTLPDNISRSFVTLMSADHTEIQADRFLAQHVGKHLELTLKLAYLGQINGPYTAQFEVGNNSTFVDFDPKWADHLVEKNVGDFIHFRAKIVEVREGHYRLQEGELL